MYYLMLPLNLSGTVLNTQAKSILLLSFCCRFWTPPCALSKSWEWSLLSIYPEGILFFIAPHLSPAIHCVSHNLLPSPLGTKTENYMASECPNKRKQTRPGGKCYWVWFNWTKQRWCDCDHKHSLVFNMKFFTFTEFTVMDWIIFCQLEIST